MEWTIIGDTEKYKNCLVSIGYPTKEAAEKAIHRMIHTPTENDKRLTAGHTNLRPFAEKDENCWWRDPFLAN